MTNDTPTSGNQTYDVVIVGGGIAGLSGALALSRARRSVLVIDSGRPRNAAASHVHNYLTREGTPPAQMLATGREEVRRYGGRIVPGTAVAAERLAEGRFRVSLEDGTAVEARRLLVTTGLADELPEVPGIAERWGREVLHCPYCHGWEVRDQPIGILATGPMAVHQALLWRQWSRQITLFTHTGPEPGTEESEQLAARDITVVRGEVGGLDVSGDRLTGVAMADGRVIPCQAVVVTPRFVARAGVLTGLGLQAVDQEMAGHAIGRHIPADPTGATQVPGVWVAGNIAQVMEMVIGAAAAALRAGAAINADLVAEETRDAVAARSAALGAQDERTTPAHHHAGGSGRDHHTGTEQDYWDGLYAESDRRWSGEPNLALVEEVSDLPPGTALDLGCGEGGDAVWLAGRGWRVTAVDISGVALERGARAAVEAGVADLIDWRRQDLGSVLPEGPFDLVSAHYLHSQVELPRERILRAAAATVAPGGVLLVVGHADHPKHHDVHLPTTEEVIRDLELADGEWEVQRCDTFERVQTFSDGESLTRTDNVVRIRRRDG